MFKVLESVIYGCSKTLSYRFKCSSHLLLKTSKSMSLRRELIPSTSTTTGNSCFLASCLHHRCCRWQTLLSRWLQYPPSYTNVIKTFFNVLSFIFLCRFLACLYKFCVNAWSFFPRYVFHCCQTTKTIICGQIWCLKTSFDMLRACAIRHQLYGDRF